jgi:hypothetical protein
MKCSDLIPLALLAKELPGKPSHSSLNRWWLRGIHGEKLITYLCGGRRYSSIALAEEFFERVTAAANGEPRRSRTSRQRKAAIRRAEEELSEDGIK